MCQQNIWELQGSSLNRQVRRAQVVKHMLRSFKSGLILDVGCAEGFVVGVDLDESIKIAKAKVKNAGFVQATITNLPFKSECFDAITLLEVLEHLPDPIMNEGIQEVDRVLKPKGILIIGVPYKEKITYTRCIHCGKLTPLWGHLRSMDEQKVTKLLPKHYSLITHLTLPNAALISLAGIFKPLPLRLWLSLNSLLGIVSKGYWLLLKYQKGVV